MRMMEHSRRGRLAEKEWQKMSAVAVGVEPGIPAAAALGLEQSRVADCCARSAGSLPRPAPR